MDRLLLAESRSRERRTKPDRNRPAQPDLQYSWSNLKKPISLYHPRVKRQPLLSLPRSSILPTPKAGVYFSIETAVLFRELA